ncbi:DNA polymerase zeta catalytic subunit [Xylocopa sonorina]|uniref:DNA polymerase zeta catalytic subunit n=1 Tax=Xylocopa sonorina TaxID=1818115 RepID=UPI00403AA6D8
MFSISLVTLDSYQSTPLSELDVTFSEFRGNEIRQVPVIRIFGCTPFGIKTCLHIHGVFPYMYIPCTINNNVDSFMYKLAASIDSAINVSLGHTMSNTQHVHKIERVCGIPLYGYHKKEHLFFKIYFYNPAIIKRAADLLQNGTILNQSLQPHEAHVPFILQFMIDYNLYGMSLINLRDIKFRQNVDKELKENFQNESLNLFDSQKCLPASILRQSTCKLEVDALASEILNRQEIQNGLDLNPGIAAIWNEENHRREEKGLQNAESQLINTNKSNRNYVLTESHIYYEEKLMKRLQSISQINENVTPVTSNTLNYPLEIENRNNSFSVLHDLDQSEVLSNKENENDFEKSMTIERLPSDKTAENSILDSEDMHLVEILANLAEENEEDNIIDNDSILGSQFSILSKQIKEDDEDDDDDDNEAENLNITSLDLNSLSSWNSVTGPASQLSMPEIEIKGLDDCKQTDCETESNVEDIPSSMDFPQYDGPCDLIIKTDKNYITKSKRTAQVNKQKFSFYRDINLCKLDHQDLDVYDTNEIAYSSKSSDYKKLKHVTENSFNPIIKNKLYYTINDVLDKLNIPALDGNIDDSSSDSGLSQDFTIGKKEKRICVYKSCVKANNNENIINVSLKKRTLELDDSCLQSPHKRRNINTNSLQSESCRTPTKMKDEQCPRSSSKKYSPLNIKIMSPKTGKSIENISPSSSKLTYATLKQNRQQLRMNLFREKINIFHLEENKGTCSQTSSINKTFIDDSASEHEVLIDLEKDKYDTPRLNFGIEIASKNTSEVRKRLNFANMNEKDIKSPVKDNKDEFHFENLSLTEEKINDTDRENDCDRNFIKVYVGEDEKMDYKYNLPSTSKNNVNLYMDNVSDKTSLFNEEDIDKEEEDICNMTYTQYLNRKLESDLSTPSVISLESTSKITENKLITITTRFNPPNRERIINSMGMYNILKSKYKVPFFSNKTDSIKQKESSNQKNNIDDIVPFKSSLDRVTGIKLWRRVKINEFHPSGSSIKSCDIKRVLAGYNSLVIHPLIHPPTVKNVTTWLQAKKYLLKKKNECKRIENSNDAANNTAKNIILNETSTDDQDTKGNSQYSSNLSGSNGFNNSVNYCLRKMLENPLLYKNDNTQYLGLSYGQIEYSLKGNSGNIENENLQNIKGLTTHQYLTVLSVEIHVVTRDKLLPDPEHDSIEAIFYAIHNDIPTSSKTGQIEHGAIVNLSIKNSKQKDIHSMGTMCPISYVSSEEDLLNSLIVLIRHCDPDILVGWEIESFSWGYIFHRASRIGLNDFMWRISRISNIVSISKGQAIDKDSFTDAKIPGRIILDVWRIMRHEITLLNYTFESVMYNVMRERISCPNFQTLSNWWKHKNITMQWKVITHYVTRTVGILRLINHLDIIGRTCEHARLFGIQFYEVFSRGSQFRVESMMLRLAKPLNYIAVSPSIQQRAKMRAPASLPLIMEPQSVFYVDPLIVLDFQSLYPSIIIAYNYCFSTCLGRVEHIGHYEPYEFGASTLKVTKDTAQKLLGKINFAPCGVAFVNSDVRMGILPRMLSEILNTRLMVKESMKLHGDKNRVLQRVLHSQQLGLKLIANVTYGYTAANFSGRMPCIEVGDSVVSKGRETLERAIKIVESTSKWGAEVVYGDTDSLFILLRGKSRKEAFAIGAEIADTVTAANPPPVKLKFEKVLQPSILQTKKRYCGYMYESPEQKEPEYLAKGIETVRRDGCPAVAKVLEKTLKILFDTKDLSLVKLYVTRQFDKILRRKISIQDLTFAKEFRGLRGYKTNACVPALELTRRLIRKDPRAIPRTGERVRYVVVAGAPNQPLIHCIRTPMEVILDEGLTPNSIYYITKVLIPPLNRCLNLIGVDANAWYREMNHRQTPDKVVSLSTDNQKLTIRQFFSAVICAACGDQTQKNICTNCAAKPNQTVTILHEKLRWLQRTYHKLTMMCQSCTGYLDEPKCESLDCPVLYRLMQAQRDLVQIPYLNDIIYNGDIIKK